MRRLTVEPEGVWKIWNGAGASGSSYLVLEIGRVKEDFKKFHCGLGVTFLCPFLVAATFSNVLML